jgi:hypothetical protein
MTIVAFALANQQLPIFPFNYRGDNYDRLSHEQLTRTEPIPA